jgi:hypothetical protein
VRIPVWGKIRENSGLEKGTQTSYLRFWKNSRLEKKNIRENSCLRTAILTNSKGFCENSVGNFRLHKRNIFPARKSLVSDIHGLGAGKKTGTVTIYSVFGHPLHNSGTFSTDFLG